MSGQGSVLAPAPAPAPVPVPVGQQQTGVFTLSRPRDFIWALNGESSCRAAEVRPPAGTRQDRSERQGATSRFRGRQARLDLNGETHTDPEETGGGAR